MIIVKISSLQVSALLHDLTLPVIVYDSLSRVQFNY